MTSIDKISDTCTCYSVVGNITLKSFLVVCSWNKIINPRNFSENMLHYNSFKTVNFIYKGCYWMHLCFSFSLFLVALINGEGCSIKQEGEKEKGNSTYTEVLTYFWPTYFEHSWSLPPLCIVKWHPQLFRLFTFKQWVIQSLDSLLKTMWMKVASAQNLISHNVFNMSCFSKQTFI